MGKKYIPLGLNQINYKVYLDDLIKIYKKQKIVKITIPKYHSNK